jgi:Mn-dependent DtxR family transcriptional regulator
MARERDESGQYVETVGPDDVLDVFDHVRGPAITSSDVADALNCTTEAARQKLTRLHEEGKVNKRKSGRTVLYWRTDRNK